MMFMRIRGYKGFIEDVKNDETLCNECKGCYLTCKYVDKYRKNKNNKCRHFKPKSSNNGFIEFHNKGLQRKGDLTFA